jgi:hypothetical protein
MQELLFDAPYGIMPLTGQCPLRDDAPTGIRTPVLALKGLCPSPLDDGGNGRILPCTLWTGQRFAFFRFLFPLKAGDSVRNPFTKL